MGLCPGQDMRKLTSAFYRCPTCGNAVEIFSDEFRRRCRKCGTAIEKENVPNCAAWCKAARQCLGPERYAEFLRKNQRVEDEEFSEDTNQGSEL